MNSGKTEWLFPMRRRMPFSPQRLNFLHPWVIPGQALGSAVKREAAARILLPSVWRGQWVGIELHSLCLLITNQAKIEWPGPYELEISETDGFQILNAIYEMSQEKLMVIGGPKSAFVIYPTPALTQIAVEARAA